MRKRVFFIFLSLFLILSCSERKELVGPGRLGVRAEKAMVVSAHPLATKVGLDVLKNGGNAIDAAVAVQFALAVVHPSAGNIGGGGFIVYRTRDGKYFTLDYREKAPAAAHRDMYLDENGKADSGKSRQGHLAAGVPGSVYGMVMAHEKFGEMPWRSLVEPSVKLARDGFPLTEKEADGLNWVTEQIRQYSTVMPSNLEREEWHEGDTISWPGLAVTLERIAEEGAEGFYKGKTAKLIVEEMRRGGGLITYEDLANYRAVWREPVVFDYKDYKMISMGPPSSGGVAIGQLFGMVSHFPVGEWGVNDVRTIHVMAECEKLVFADRAEYLGDPDFIEVPVFKLLDPEYLALRTALISLDKARQTTEISAGQFIEEHEETTHFSIVDAEGNAVSCTTTLNGSYGNYVVVGGAGFLLNNEMDDFSSKPGVPNMYGLIGGEANAIEPGKRMLSSMTPTIVEKNGKLFMVTGTPGGSTIITSVFQNILNVIEFGMNMQGAVDFKRFHHQWRPDYIQYEKGRFDRALRKKLKKLGHSLKKRDAIGRVDAILVREDGSLEGGADPRGDDTAMGF